MRELKNINQKKLKRQKEGINRWFNSSLYGSYKDRNGCMNYATGFGKTFTSALIINKYLKEKEKASIMIICPPFLVSQWQEVLNSLFYKKEIRNVNIFSPDKLIRGGLIYHPDLLIIDELHEFYNKERMNLINKKQIIYRDLLALTATYEDNKDRHLEIQSFCPIVDKIGESEAISKGYISKFIEYNLGLEFTREEAKEHERLSKLIREGLSKFGKGSLTLAMQCLSGGKRANGEFYKSTFFCYNWAKYNGWREGLNLANPADRELNDLWNPSMIFGYSVNLMRNIKNRKELIYTSSNKLAAAVAILENFKYTKTIVFNQSIVFADLLYNIMNDLQPDNAVIFHSKVKTQMLPSPKTGKLIKFGAIRLKKRAIERIKSGQANHLITSSVLDKGLDVPDLKIGVTTSGTQNPTPYIQRGGRVKRVDKSNKEGVVILVNLYIKKSKDVTWLKNRQSRSNNIIYWINDVNEISYKPKQKEQGININIKDI